MERYLNSLDNLLFTSKIEEYLRYSCYNSNMNNSNRHLTKEEIIRITEKSMHKTFGELGMTSYNLSKKGGLGVFIEENLFEYKANNDDSPDFIDEGIELKLTPVKKNNDETFSSKERLVLNMLNYCDEADKTFETSSFYLKIEDY